MLLSLKIKPTIVTSTTGFTILFTSTMTLSQQILFGGISFNEILWFGSLSLIGSYLVSSLIIYYCRKYKRESVILFVIVAVVFIALLIIPFNGISRIMDKGIDVAFSSFC